ncbi:hypothetical protein H9P43_003650 [Blastocladiella emersonii ATCC 22665]|nr:hypothetical protein H9P43_003650 [Blastocladiella emersonii ATCC 22665]
MPPATAPPQPGTAAAPTSPPTPARRCIVCSDPATSACSQCGPAVAYCSQACQLDDWPRHASECKSGAATRAAASSSSAAPGAVAPDTTSGPRNRFQAAPAEPHHAAPHLVVPEATRARLEDLGFDPDAAADLLFYTGQVFQLMKPILICIALSIAWTKISLASTDFRPASSIWTVYQETPSSTGGERLAGGFANAGIILGQIAVMTVLLVVLFKYNCMKVIYGIFGLVMISVLGFTGFLLLLAVIQVGRVVIDYITLTFALYNFAIVGIAAIFWRAPRWVQQVYLVLMSSLMAFALTGLQEWTTWILLGLLVVWDLFAVLSPYGPLRHLLNTVKEKNQSIEMLVYSVGGCVWMMSSFGARATSGPADAALRRHSSLIDDGSDSRILMDGGGATTPAPSSSRDAPPPPAATGSAPAPAEDEEDDDEDDDGGLKLGLGDFVFYSVLTARAAMNDWITTVASIIAVTAGMTLTIFLLAIFRKALPALPISITFGMLFYFCSAVTLSPLMEAVANQGLVL